MQNGMAAICAEGKQMANLQQKIRLKAVLQKLFYSVSKNAVFVDSKSVNSHQWSKDTW